MPYGVANQIGQVSRDEATTILHRAWAAGIDTIDTAMAYGLSEKRLGEIGVSAWRVITKLPAVPSGCSNVDRWVRESVGRSLERLRIPRLAVLLLHRSSELLAPHGTELHESLARLKADGLVTKTGVSIYAPSELSALWPHADIDVVQAPFNVLDRRLATSGWLSRLNTAGVEVHTRSVFLQGLLLMSDGSRPVSFERWQPLWQRWHAVLATSGVSALQASLAFAFSRPEIDRIIVGVDDIKQLDAILGVSEATLTDVPASLECTDLDLIDPSNWIKR